VPGPANGR